MTCARCDALAADLAAVREELAAWEAHDAGEGRAERSLERIGRWQDRFRLTVSEAMILLALVDAGGRPVTTETLKKVTRHRPGADHAREVESNVVQILICRLRKALDRDGLGDVVQTLRHVGYLVSPLGALALKSRVAEA